MEVKELTQKLIDWEINAGESFMDYFLHDNVKASSWGFWLLGKGYIDFGNNIISKFIKDEYLEQEELFDVFGADIDDDSDKWNKNFELWAEFLLATPTYTERVYDFLKDDEE